VLIEDLEFLALAWWIRARTARAAAPCSSSAGKLDRARVS
jgi:hypothetical protein